MRLLFTALAVTVAASCMAQEVNSGVPKDSIADRATQPVAAQTTETTLLAPITTDFRTPLPSPDADRPGVQAQAYDVTRAITRPYIAKWDTGGIIGYNGMYSEMYGFGTHAGAVLTQGWGDRWTLNVNMELSKDMMDGVGVTNGLGTDMQLEYRLGRNASLTAIGGISNYGWMGPAMNQTTAYYGGYLTLNTNNDKWAVDLGVRQVYNSMTGQWEMVPIVMPYYKLGGAKLGIDFGGLIRSAFDSASESVVNMQPSSRHYRGPAIIAPPIDMKPKKLSTEVPASMGNSCMK